MPGGGGGVHGFTFTFICTFTVGCFGHELSGASRPRVRPSVRPRACPLGPIDYRLHSLTKNTDYLTLSQP